MAVSGLGGWLTACGQDAPDAPAPAAGEVYAGQSSVFSYDGRPPNVLLIVADDVSSNVLSPYGGPIRVPNLERMAAEGLRFEQCFSSPSCLASRIQLLTGRYLPRAATTHPPDPEDASRTAAVLENGEPTVAGLLSRAGYRTAVAGKGHAFYSPRSPDRPAELGFDSWCVTHARGKPQRSELVLDVDGTPVPFLPGREDQEIVDYLARFVQTPSEAPFLALYLTRLAHKPWLPARPDGEAAWEPPEPGPEYYDDEIVHLDRQVGRLLDVLASTGLDRDTIVLFLADNGSPEEIQTGVRVGGQKGTLLDGGVRVPLIVRWPGRVPAGALNRSDLVELTDFLPTLAELAGVSLPADRIFDGVSLWPVLGGDGERGKDWVFLHTRQRCALRTVHWKLMGSGELFDLAADPAEREPIPPDGTGGDAIPARARMEVVLRSVIRSMVLEGARYRTVYA